MVHEKRGGFIGHIPESGNDVVGACLEEGPRKTDQAFAGVRLRSSSATGGDGYQLHVQRLVEDCARGKFVGPRHSCEHDRRIQRAPWIGGTVSGEMHIVERLAGRLEIGLWSSF